MIWFPGLTWKTEYRFADYGKDTIGLLFDGSPDARSVEAHKYVHTVRSTLTWRFNFGGPVLGRYDEPVTRTRRSPGLVRGFCFAE